MYSIGMVTIDCHDVRKLTDFWTKALGAEIVNDYGEYVILGSTPALALQQVPDPTPGKNRIHIDGSGDKGRESEVTRLVGLGAREGETHDMPGFSWTVMYDPEDNAFCVSDPHE